LQITCEGIEPFKLPITTQVAYLPKKKTLFQYKTTFNFQVKVKLGNIKLNKKWHPFGITISFTQKPRNCLESTSQQKLYVPHQNSNLASNA
jgi:hypothetical protein